MKICPAKTYHFGGSVWRGGRVAEGDGLLNRYTLFWVSRVRIPSSPFSQIFPLRSTETSFSLFASFQICDKREEVGKFVKVEMWDSKREGDNNHLLSYEPGVAEVAPKYA